MSTTLTNFVCARGTALASYGECVCGRAYSRCSRMVAGTDRVAQRVHNTEHATDTARQRRRDCRHSQIGATTVTRQCFYTCVHDNTRRTCRIQ
jgi:hypothetical protein